MVSLTDSKYIVANTISDIDKTKVIDLKEFVLSKLYAINHSVGLRIATLNSLQKLAEAINSDAIVFDTIMNALNLKSDVVYVDTQFYIIITKSLTYDTKDDSNIKFVTKSYKLNTCLKYDVDVFLYILQAGIDRRVLINAVDNNGRFKINAATNDVLKIQKVDGSTLYDSL